MTELLDRIPDEVVIRHVCHCANATVTPTEGELDVHEFTIDGEDFPWYISERGPVVKQIKDDLYEIEVDIIGFTVDDDKAQPLILSYDTTYATPYQPLIGGKSFPWLLTDQECVIRFSHKQIPTLTLAFYAHNVTGNCPITHALSAEDVYCAGGSLIHAGEVGEP